MPVTQPAVLDLPELDDDAAARSGLRKASLRLIPLIALGYGTAYMDRVNISFASLQMKPRPALQCHRLRARSGPLLPQLCRLRGAFEPDALSLWRRAAGSPASWSAGACIAMAMITRPQAVGVLYRHASSSACRRSRLLLPESSSTSCNGSPPQQRCPQLSPASTSLSHRSVQFSWEPSPERCSTCNGKLGSRAAGSGFSSCEALPAVVLGVIYFLYLPDGSRRCRNLAHSNPNAVRNPQRHRSRPLTLTSTSRCRSPRPARPTCHGCSAASCSACSPPATLYRLLRAPAILIKTATALSDTRHSGFVIAGHESASPLPAWSSTAQSQTDDARHSRTSFPGCLMMVVGFLGAQASSSSAIPADRLACS